MKILIAEDDPVMRQLLRRNLENWGHDVIVCVDGLDAWNSLRRQKVKLVIADWIMPEIDGIELCRKIRSLKDTGYLYIILLTGKDKKEDAVRGLDAGADDYITKPFEWEELGARIRTGARVIGLVNEVRTLSGLLPICSSCKKIRDDKGYWENIETYIRNRTETEFTHGICPECAVKIYPRYFKD
jgi:sigma-B regulation protein RsbU (phosphoserine phosphatase)